MLCVKLTDPCIIHRLYKNRYWRIFTVNAQSSASLRQTSVGLVNNPVGGLPIRHGKKLLLCFQTELKVMFFASCVEPLAYSWENFLPWKTKALFDRVTLTLVFTHFPGYPTPHFLTSVSSCAQTPPPSTPTLTVPLSDWLLINLISVSSMCHLTKTCRHNKLKYKVCTYTFTFICLLFS